MDKMSFDKSMEEIKKALLSIKYGSLTIVVQDGYIVQLEKNEKIKIR